MSSTAGHLAARQNTQKKMQELRNNFASISRIKRSTMGATAEGAAVESALDALEAMNAELTKVADILLKGGL